MLGDQETFWAISTPSRESQTIVEYRGFSCESLNVRNPRYKINAYKASQDAGALFLFHDNAQVMSLGVCILMSERKKPNSTPAQQRGAGQCEFVGHTINTRLFHRHHVRHELIDGDLGSLLPA